MAIEQIDEKTFRTTARGTTMTLIRATDGWDMMSRNASTQAWNRGMPSIKHFGSLAEVESRYKSWKGISQLLADHRKGGLSPT